MSTLQIFLFPVFCISFIIRHWANQVLKFGVSPLPPLEVGPRNPARMSGGAL